MLLRTLFFCLVMLSTVLLLGLPGCAGDPARGDATAPQTAGLSFGDVQMVSGGGEVGARLDAEGRVWVRATGEEEEGAPSWRHLLTLRPGGDAVSADDGQVVATLRPGDNMVMLAGGRETGLVILEEGAVVSQANGARLSLDEEGNLVSTVAGAPQVRLEGVTAQSRVAALYAFTLLSIPRAGGGQPGS